MEPSAKRMRMGGGGPDSPEYQEVIATFLNHPQLQQHAIDQFLVLTPQQQLVVMQRGLLTEARDPTAVLISRVVQARKAPITSIPAGSSGFRAASASHFAEPTSESLDFDVEVAFFLNLRQIQLSAVHEFMALSPQQQSQVMSMGPLSAFGDPTADLVSRLAQVGSRRPAAAATAAGPPLSAVSSPQTVQAFLNHNNIQPHAAERFLALPPEEQMNIVAMGPLTDARDPTAVLIARMTKGGRTVQTPSPGDWYCPNCGDLQFSRNAECRNCQTPNPNPMAPRPAPPSHALKTRMCTYFVKGNCTKGNLCTFAHGEDEMPQIDAETVAQAATSIQQLFGISEEEVQMFLNGCEAHAIQRFLSLPAGEQMLIMNRGSLVDARNPTAVLVTRMNSLSKTKRTVY
eukprot:TRINITY_DN19522_c1_g1_i2.p1 TRINITY_DN19522_c1_g1~~TRINITY_DN19522_c1_g1_i2.p1  ORF type:complete len:401 (-),score=61.06 TRINITY_DN19522_c1_g1_i2:857-2059(-)